MSKAGRLVGLADSCAVIVLADSATFLLAVNCMAAFRSHSAVMLCIVISCCGSVGWASAHQLGGRGFEHNMWQDFPHVCAHFGIHGRNRIILPRFRQRGQLQYRTALGMSINDISCLQLSTLICPLSARWWTTQMKKIFTLKSKILICGKCMEGLVHWMQI